MRLKDISIFFFLFSINFKSGIGETVILDEIGDLKADNGIVPEPEDSLTNYAKESVGFKGTFPKKLDDAFGTSIGAVKGIWAISDDTLDLLPDPLVFKLPVSDLESFTVTYYSPVEARIRFLKTPTGEPYSATTTLELVKTWTPVLVNIPSPLRAISKEIFMRFEFPVNNPAKNFLVIDSFTVTLADPTTTPTTPDPTTAPLPTPPPCDPAVCVQVEFDTNDYSAFPVVEQGTGGYFPSSSSFNAEFTKFLAVKPGLDIARRIGLWAFSSGPTHGATAPLKFKLPPSDLIAFSIEYYCGVGGAELFFTDNSGKGIGERIPLGSDSWMTTEVAIPSTGRAVPVLLNINFDVGKDVEAFILLDKITFNLPKDSVNLPSPTPTTDLTTLGPTTPTTDLTTLGPTTPTTDLTTPVPSTDKCTSANQDIPTQSDKGSEWYFVCTWNEQNGTWFLLRFKCGTGQVFSNSERKCV